jgi:hypothetical protein
MALRASPTGRSVPRMRIPMGLAGQKSGPTRRRTANTDGRGVRNDANPAQNLGRICVAADGTRCPIAFGRLAARLP